MIISARAKLLIAGVLVLIAVVLILWWPRRGKTPPPAPTANQTNQQVTTNSQSTATPTPATPLTAEQRQAASAETVAKSFIERFGSYSSESEAQNLEDLLPLTTASYRAKMEAQIADLRAAGASDEYYGVSTRLLTLTEVSMGESSAEFSALTQREEAKGTLGNTSVKYQTLNVTLQLVGEDWLVSGASWE